MGRSCCLGPCLKNMAPSKVSLRSSTPPLFWRHSCCYIWPVYNSRILTWSCSKIQRNYKIYLSLINFFFSLILNFWIHTEWTRPHHAVERERENPKVAAKFSGQIFRPIFRPIFLPFFRRIFRPIFRPSFQPMFRRFFGPIFWANCLGQLFGPTFWINCLGPILGPIC